MTHTDISSPQVLSETGAVGPTVPDLQHPFLPGRIRPFKGQPACKPALRSVLFLPSSPHRELLPDAECVHHSLVVLRPLARSM